VRDAYAPRTLAAQAAGAIDEATGAIVRPMHLATTFERDPAYADWSRDIYGRPDNPTARDAEAVIGALEGAAETLVFGSGMSAAVALFLGLGAGAHIVAPTKMYWALRNWLGGEARSFGLAVDFVDAEEIAEVERALRPGETKLVWLETPSNPLWGVSDIAATAERAHAAGALLAVDSTCATPIFTRPLQLGADVVMHSATKYLNGHSDTLAGALCFAKADGLFERARDLRKTHGLILHPFGAFLLTRGLRTLDLRVRASALNALKLANRLIARPTVASVLYPGLPAHPGHATALKQMAGGFGGMLSIRVHGGAEAAIAVAARTRLWKRATSLGGVESLIEHRASYEGPDSPCPPDLLRLSAGVEDVEDLWADLVQALGE
jgi:cystathionine gamma-synthase